MKKSILPILLSVPLGGFGNPMQMHGHFESIDKAHLSPQATIDPQSMEGLSTPIYREKTPSAFHSNQDNPLVEERSILTEAIGRVGEKIQVTRHNLSHVHAPKDEVSFDLVPVDQATKAPHSIEKMASVDVFGFTTPELKSEAPTTIDQHSQFAPKSHPLEIFPSVNSNMRILLGFTKDVKAPQAKVTALRIAHFVHNVLVQPKRLLERAIGVSADLESGQTAQYAHRPKAFDATTYTPYGEDFESAVATSERQIKVDLQHHEIDDLAFENSQEWATIPIESSISHEKQAIASRLTRFVHNALHPSFDDTYITRDHKPLIPFSTHSYQDTTEVKLASHTPQLNQDVFERDTPYYKAKTGAIDRIENRRDKLDKVHIETQVALNPHAPIIKEIRNSRYVNTKKLLSRFLPNEQEQEALAVANTTEVHLDRDQVEVRFADWTIEDHSLVAISTQHKSQIDKEHIEPTLAVKPTTRPVEIEQHEEQHATATHYHPDEEDIPGAAIDLGQGIAFTPIEAPEHTESFDSIENQQTPVEIVCNYRVPKSSHSRFPSSSVSLESTPVEQEESTPLKPLLSQFDPTNEAQEAQHTPFPLLVRNLKHLNPHTQKPKILSIQKLELHKPFIVMKESSQQKAFLPRIDSTTLEAKEPIKTEIAIDIKPLAFNSYIALHEKERQVPAGILTHECKLQPTQHKKAYQIDHNAKESFAIAASYTPPKASHRNALSEQFNAKYQARRSKLQTLQQPLKLEEKALFDFPELNVNVTATSADVKQADSTLPTNLKLIEVERDQSLALHTPATYHAPSTSAAKPLLFSSFDELYQAKEQLGMERNPLHSLSFLKKIEIKPYSYGTQLVKPLPKAFHMEYENYKNDLMNSIAHFKAQLPQHANRFNDYIDLLSINEAHFDPNATQAMEKTKADFSELLAQGRDEHLEAFADREDVATFASLHDLNTQVLSSEFKTDVQVIAKPNNDGYYFALSVTPYFPEELRRIRQNIYFVLDQNRSISKDRFNAFKKSILRALPYVNPDDTFNIIVFDKHFESLGSENQYYSKETMAKARRFLDNIRHGSLASPKDYTRVLEHISEKYDPDPNELNVIILLTDGAAYKAHHLQKDKVQNLTKVNNNQFAIHTISAAQNNYLSALDLVSFMNHGKMLHSKSHAALPRQLAILVKHLRYPLATNLNLSVLTTNDSQIKFFPESGNMQHFYGHQPLTIYGEAESLCEFELMIQGQCEEEWVNITQSVNLQQATPGDRELVRDASLLEKKVRKLP